MSDADGSANFSGIPPTSASRSSFGNAKPHHRLIEREGDVDERPDPELQPTAHPHG